jgi:cytoskeletal protein CcmA (bactofilin family)
MLFSGKSKGHRRPAPAPTDASERALERTPATQPPDGTQTAGRSDGTHAQSFIDASLTIVGDLHSQGDVRIDGQIRGNVRCAQLIVGKDAVVAGAVTVEEAIVRGKITGDICSPVVILQDTAHVEAGITYGLLAIDDGAFFEGVAHRRDNLPKEEAAASPIVDLQQMTLAAEGAHHANAETPADGCEMGAETAADPPPAVRKPLGANGHAPEASAHEPSK